MTVFSRAAVFIEVEFRHIAGAVMNQVEHAAVHLRDVERIDGFIVRLAVAAGRGARLAQEEIVERYDNCAGAQLFELIAQNLCGRCFPLAEGPVSMTILHRFSGFKICFAI